MKLAHSGFLTAACRRQSSFIDDARNDMPINIAWPWRMIRKRRLTHRDLMQPEVR
jgi:hypothetical protein